MDRVISYPGIVQTTAELTKSRAMVAPNSVLRILEVILLGHIIVVSFQVLLRALVFDMTFYRDILLFSAIALWVPLALTDMAKSRSVKGNLLDRFFTLYLLYGVITTLIAYFINNVGILESITQFRNSFLPAALFFAAKKSFESPKAQARLVNLFLILTLIFIGDTLIEFMVMQFGLSPYKIPWYPYVFRVNTYFIGNEVSAVGAHSYLQPENSPTLGLLGFPNFTAPTLIALFAFSYPFLMERLKGNRASLLGCLALLSVFVLNVQTHLVTGLMVLLVLPLFTHPKWIKRNLVILVFAGLALLSISSLRSSLISSAQLRFLGDQMNRSHLEVILDTDQIAFLASSSPLRLLFGTANLGSAEFSDFEAWEFRLLFFTAIYGLVWLVLFLGLFVLGFVYAFRLFRSVSSPPLVRSFAVGTIGLLAVYLLEMGHYARTMWAPNIDLWVIVLGTTSALMSQLLRQKSTRTTRRAPAIRGGGLRGIPNGIPSPDLNRS